MFLEALTTISGATTRREVVSLPRTPFLTPLIKGSCGSVGGGDDDRWSSASLTHTQRFHYAPSRNRLPALPHVQAPCLTSLLPASHPRALHALAVLQEEGLKASWHGHTASQSTCSHRPQCTERLETEIMLTPTDNYFNDLVAYDIAGASWRSLGAVESGDKPSPRYQFGMALSGNSVYVMSGGNASGDLLGAGPQPEALERTHDLSANAPPHPPDFGTNTSVSSADPGSAARVAELWLPSHSRVSSRLVLRVSAQCVACTSYLSSLSYHGMTRARG